MTTASKNGRKVVIYDAYSASNATLDTGTLDVGDFDAVLVEELPSGTASVSSIGLYDPDLSTTTSVGNFATAASTSAQNCGWGVGVGGASAAGNYIGGVPAPLPIHLKVVLGALGTGIVGRLRVIGWKNY